MAGGNPIKNLIVCSHYIEIALNLNRNDTFCNTANDCCKLRWCSSESLIICHTILNVNKATWAQPKETWIQYMKKRSTSVNIVANYLGSKDSFRRHLKTIHYSKTRDHSCSLCGFSTVRLNSIRRHLKSSQHSKRARDVTKYILDFLNSSREKSPIETRPCQADPSTGNSYIYQQTMPKNKEKFPWVLHTLDTALMPSRVHKWWYLLVKDPINIPFDSTQKLEDHRLDYYSPSLTKDLSELNAMLCTQLETEGTNQTNHIWTNRWHNPRSPRRGYPSLRMDNFRLYRNYRWLLIGA